MKLRVLLSIPLSMFIYSNVIAHGDVTPQAMDTSDLPQLGEEWLEENPWRDPENENWLRSANIGASGYNQNCARCHGLGGVSGGLAPDLRLLSADMDGDEWYLERFRNGMTQNGITKMPGFGEILSQEAAWAIRTYLETRPEDDAFKDHNDRLVEIRDSLKGMADAITAGGKAESFAAAAKEFQKELSEIGDSAKTASKAPKADSPISQAAGTLLEITDASFGKAAEVLTIGLSAAK
uniref:Cytochrome C550 (Soluble cytochrome C) n=1 Tax=uncultured Thiotrichaceae bacterium TaxID=298394 RepID=A0A6S6TVF6_9GAMM|nr:MAG: Cytochrome C550 (Soluble cytochrome C) [uncultured Thiotrichaceae bacterium]